MTYSAMLGHRLFDCTLRWFLAVTSTSIIRDFECTALLCFIDFSSSYFLILAFSNVLSLVLSLYVYSLFCHYCSYPRSVCCSPREVLFQSEDGVTFPGELDNIINPPEGKVPIYLIGFDVGYRLPTSDFF